MGIGEYGPKSPVNLAYYSETEAARHSELTVEAVACCVTEGLVTVVMQDGVRSLSDSDLTKLRLVKAMISVQRLEDGIARIYRKMGQERISIRQSSCDGVAADTYSRVVRLILDHS